MNPLRQLLDHGQSYWLDNLTREMIRTGALARRVTEEGLRGVTSNPATFQKAISKGHEYDDQIATLVREGLPVASIYERLTVADVQAACDILRPVYDESAGLDGYVSLEVSPYLAYDAHASLQETRRLHRLVDRANVFIKIPGTHAGVAAIEEALFEGININITLLFSIAHYQAVAEAYLRSLERRAEAGRSVDDVASVASFFLSRIDVLVDQLLGHRIQPAVTAGPGLRPEQLLGRAAIANAKLAYRHLKSILDSDRWKRLDARGARVQRLLWASTSTKDPLYDEIRYVEPLIGRHTVNTMPAKTIRAFAQRGAVVADTVEGDIDDARTVMEQLAAVGINFDSVTWQLEHEGVQKFRDPFDRLMATLAERRQSILAGEVATQAIQAGSTKDSLEAVTEALNDRQFGRRLHAKDPSLWSSDPHDQESIRHRLGWLDSLEAFRSRIADVTAFADRVRDEGFTHVVLLGMGGSSVSAEVCRDTFGPAVGWPDLLVLHSTDPAAIRDVEGRINLSHTLFVVASKSGTTTETISFYRYFWEATREAISTRGTHFVAITDPGTPLAREAASQGFRRTFENPDDIGGRFSALSYFGLVPMALLGLDVARLLDRALVMQRTCGPFIPADRNPGLHLGALLGLAARRGRDKVTFVPSRSLDAFGAWAEQLLAESTGKAGRGLIPVDGEPLSPFGGYGPDRLFVSLRQAAADDVVEANKFLDERRAEGHPTVRIEVSDPLDLGAEFLRWELAAAVAGSVLGVNPFDEPNVAESKRNTTELLKRWEQNRSFPDSRPLAGDGWMNVYGEPAQSRLAHSTESVLRHFLAAANSRDYIALLAYVHRTKAIHEVLTSFRAQLRERLQIATTLGYGPRYLHSAGQLHKGGPNTGLFLLLTADPSEDLPIPAEAYGFETLLRAQALGDHQALVGKGRRVLHIHLRGDLEPSLVHLGTVIESALTQEATQLR